MAGIKVGLGFERTSTDPIDLSITLSKAEMLAVQDNQMPDNYFAICKDDGKLYLYDKNATPNAETGKYTLHQSGGTYDDTALAARVTANENALADTYTKAEVIAEIESKLAAYDKLDYRKADSPPTATTVTIDGTDEAVVEGVRYIVQDATENRFLEYVVLNGTVYNLGPASSSAVSAELAAALTVSNPIGKYAQGATIPADTSLEEVLRGILSKTYYPALNPPTAVLSYSLSALAKVGQTIPTASATLSLNRGSIDPQYTADSGYRSGEATGYSLAMANADAPYDDTSVDGSFSVPAFTKSSKGTVTLTGTVSYAAGVQPKDSDGANYESALDAGSVTASKSIEFILPRVHGISATATISDFTGLTETLERKKNETTLNFAPNNQHVVFAYDAAYGDLTSILDINGFENISGFTKSNLTVDGQLYAVYVMDNKTTDAGARYTFKF